MKATIALFSLLSIAACSDGGSGHRGMSGSKISQSYVTELGTLERGAVRNEVTDSSYWGFAGNQDSLSPVLSLSRGSSRIILLKIQNNKQYEYIIENDDDMDDANTYLMVSKVTGRAEVDEIRNRPGTMESGNTLQFTQTTPSSNTSTNSIAGVDTTYLVEGVRTMKMTANLANFFCDYSMDWTETNTFKVNGAKPKKLANTNGSLRASCGAPATREEVKALDLTKVSTCEATDGNTDNVDCVEKDMSFLNADL